MVQLASGSFILQSLEVVATDETEVEPEFFLSCPPDNDICPFVFVLNRHVEQSVIILLDSSAVSK